MTERLDDAMAHAQLYGAASYTACWRQVADAAARHLQLQVVLALGKSLTSLTPKLGLRMLLKLMRGPAAAAGFDDFQIMHGSDEFLELIALREADWIQRLFEEDDVACETKLNELLAGHTAIS